MAALAQRFGRKQQNVKLMMVGPEAAGKTTILYKLKLGDVVPTFPTVGFTVESVEYKNLRLDVWEMRDMVGQEKIRRLWQHAYEGTNAIIFVVDSSDRARIENARTELHCLVQDDDLKKAAVLVLANKQDLPNAMTAAELTTKLELHNLPSHTSYFLQPTCATSGDGLIDGLEWLSQHMKVQTK